MASRLIEREAQRRSRLVISGSFRVDFEGALRPYAAFGRTACMAINCLRAIHRFDSANSVSTWAVFFCSPRNRTFSSPNWRLITRNGCSTFARMLAL